MKTRLTNQNSHIKLKRRFCEVSKHFADNGNLHRLDKSSQSNYDISLKQQIEVIITEQVDLS